MEQQSGPPSTDGGSEEVRTGPELHEDSAGRPEPEVTRPDVSLAKPPEATEAESKAEPGKEAGPIMSSLPHSRPQQRSQRRRAPAKARSASARQASGTPRKRASGRSQAPAKAPAAQRTPSRTQAKANARATAAPSKDAPGIPALAVDAAVQIAKAPLKLTVAATRRTFGLIGRGLRL